MKKNNIRKGDLVRIISGEQKGFLGKIETVLNKKSSVIVQGILPRVKWIKNSSFKNTEQKKESKKIELPTLIHISNVMHWDQEINKRSRIGYKLEKTISTNNDVQIKKQRYYIGSGRLVPSSQTFEKEKKNLSTKK
jgi:large subunit ribosomal protein L24